MRLNDKKNTTASYSQSVSLVVLVDYFNILVNGQHCGQLWVNKITQPARIENLTPKPNTIYEFEKSVPPTHKELRYSNFINSMKIQSFHYILF